MKTIKIFIASSGELSEERKELALLISSENKILVKNNIFIELVVWEELLHSFRGERIQDYFNEEMVKCDIVIALFYKKVGQFTKEEFDLAYENLKEGKKPKYLYVYFKSGEIPIEEIDEDILKIKKLKDEIKAYKQIYGSYNSIEELKLKLKNQIDKIISFFQRSKLTLTLELDYDAFEEKHERLLLHALAGFLGISPGDINVLSKERGSTIVTLELPYESAERLRIALQGKDLKFLNAMEKFSPAIIEKQTKLPKHLTPIPAYNQENLIGRKGLLEKIHQKLTNNREVVLVNGLGGIGKTTLAYAYVNEETYTKHYNHIAWVTVMDNIKDALVNQLSNDDTGFTYNPNEDIDANLKCLSDTMRHFDGDNLLVIDNANDSEDILNNKKSIEAFDWKVLFTSRATPAGTTIIPVEELEPEDAKELFCRFYKRKIDDEILTKLLAHIEYHTLLTELLAKAANKNRKLDISALYNMVESEGIKAPRLGVKIPIGKHADQRDIEKEQKLYNYILTIFDLGDLSEDEKEYLRYFSVLPSTTIEANALFDFFKIEEDNETAFYEVLDELVKKGWLQETEDSYKAHPLIQTVARERLKPGTENCSTLIDTFIDKLSVKAHENPLDGKVFIPYAESILNVIDEDDIALATLAGNLSSIIEVFGNYRKSLEYGLKTLAIHEKMLDIDHPSLATSYCNISLTYQNLGSLEKSLEYGLKALAIREKVLDKDHPDLANSYNNISITYKHLGDLEKSLEYGLKTLGICEKVFDKDNPYLATSYCNISVTYQNLGSLETSLEYGLKALAIREKVLDKDHPDLANSFLNIASTYYHLKDYQQAKGYIDKAVDIYQRVLPVEHPDLKNALVWQGNIYLKLSSG